MTVLIYVSAAQILLCTRTSIFLHDKGKLDQELTFLVNIARSVKSVLKSTPGAYGSTRDVTKGGTKGTAAPPWGTQIGGGLIRRNS